MSGTMQQTRLNSRTLKDFLSENSSPCSSNGFKSFPRKPIPTTTMRSLIEMDLKSSSSSSRNSNPRILNSLINAVVKSISSFTVVKSPSILPRSLSRKLSKKVSSKNDREGEIKVTVRIKDIVRWRSFPDAAAAKEQPQPLEFSSSTTSTTTSCSSSNGSSWGDGDFTCGYVSSCDSNFVEVVRNDVGMAKRFTTLVGKDSVDATAGMALWAKEDFTCQEELRSPVSVLQIGEDEFSPFDQSLANIERRKQKSMQTIQRFDSLTNLDSTTLDKCLLVDKNISSEEEYDNDDEDEDNEEQDRIERRARQLLHCIKAKGSAKCSKAKLDQLLLDFFRDELKTRRNYQSRINDDEDAFEREIMKIAEDWIDGSFEYDLEHSNKDDCIREMDRRETWSKFEEEQEELAWEIETDMLENLVVEIFKVR